MPESHLGQYLGVPESPVAGPLRKPLNDDACGKIFYASQGKPRYVNQLGHTS